MTAKAILLKKDTFNKKKILIWNFIVSKNLISLIDHCFIFIMKLFKIKQGSKKSLK